MSPCRPVLLYLLFFSTFLHGYSQYHTLKFEQPDFLNRNITFYQYNSFQDQEGFLWIAGSEGLTRYDGYAVRRFKYNPNDTTSLPSNEVRRIAESASGELWFATSLGGFCRFDKRTERFQRFDLAHYGKYGLISDQIRDILLLGDSLILLSTDLGLCLFEWEKFHQTGIAVFQEIEMEEPSEEALPIEKARLLLDAKGNLWAGSDRGLTFIPAPELKNGTFRRKKQPLWLKDTPVSDLAVGWDGDLWIGTIRGLARLSAGKLNSPSPNDLHWFTHQPQNERSLGSNVINCLLTLRNGDLWIGTYDHGISVLSREEMAATETRAPLFTHYEQNAQDPGSLTSNQIGHLYEDHSQNIWVCTYHKLQKVYQLQSQFHHTHTSPNLHDPGRDNNIFAVYQDPEGIIWTGSKSGLGKFDRKTGQMELLPVDAKDPANPRANAIRGIIPKGRDTLLITSLHGFWVFGKSRSRFTRLQGLSPEESELLENKSYHLIEDHLGQVLIGTQLGLFVLDKDLKHLKVISHDPDDPSSLSHNYVRFVFEDRQSNLWLGTENGLDLLPAAHRADSKPQFKHFRYDSRNPATLSNDEVRWITQTADGTIWVGTDGGGFNALNPENENFTRFGESEGLSNNVVYAMLPDSKGNLWISTNNGISRFDPTDKTFTNFEESDGLQGYEFNVRSAFKSPQGELFFGGTNGFNHFFPEKIIANEYAPRVKFTNLLLKNIPVDFRTSNLLSQPLHLTSELSLSWRDQVFTLEMAAMEFSAPAENQFKYQMQGLSEEWIPLGHDHKITFNQLSPGRYTLRALASNNDGIWGTEPAVLRITIQAPPWKTWWAYGLYLAFFLTLTSWIIRSRFRRIRLQNQLRIEKLQSEKLREIERIKSDFLANVSHELRTPLTLIKGPVHKLLETASDPQEKRLLTLVEQNSERLLRMINQLLEASRLEANKEEFHPEWVDLQEFFESIFFNFTTAATDQGIQLQLLPPAQPVNLTCDREKMEHIFYNLVGNALKFTAKGGKITLSWLEINPETVQIKVEDTGRGIPAEDIPHLFDRFYQVSMKGHSGQGGTGLGLSLVRDLVKMHKGTVKVESEPGQGTVFMLEFPKTQSDSAQYTPVQEVKPASPLPLREPEAERQEETGAISSRPVVLVVEDNDGLRAFIRDELAAEFEVVEAENGRIGLEKAREMVPDLVVTDLMMPVMDGMQLTSHLKNEVATSHIPVIMLTAKASDASKISGLESGADDYLTKPFNARELILRMQNMLKFRDRLQQQFGQSEGAVAEAKVGEPGEDLFLQRVKAAVLEHLDQSEYSVEDLAATLNLSTKQLQRKLKALSGQSPNQFMRNLRLDESLRHFENAELNVSEIGYMVGFSSPSYFAKCFQERFGKTPTEWRG
ncbi:MAG: response regulator [Bacteroidia bacterium]|nr:response regulator [Bacteroidia bacterium]